MNAITALQSNMGHTLACVGLDPDLVRMPHSITNLTNSPEDKIFEFLKIVVDRTALHVCAYKAQKAFFDPHAAGHDLLKGIAQHVHNFHPGLPVILDCKVGDIDNTMSAYIDNIFGRLGADGIVVNPYMGSDVLAPLMELKEKAIMVLCKTSNAGGAMFQDVLVTDGRFPRPMWQYVLDKVVNPSCFNRSGNMVPVVSSTAGLDVSYVRRLIPNETPILLAGVGAQGGSYADLGKLLNPQRSGVFVNSSRGILYSYGREDEDWATKVELATVELRNALNAQRK